ncbi:phage holin family protein [Escherichia coli]|uniref:phage holin family protein n=1 Tax=Escherichia coli TaxID=562 RepID=UPI0010CB51D5|nr:phage holin family protein [Escherichia coli]GDB38122.1 inner membrane protein [Escherichia coli]
MRTGNIQPRGPSRSLVDNIHRVFNTLTGIFHNRIELIAIELEEEKKNILGLLLMVGLALIFTVFGVVSLLIFILLSVSPEHRLIISGGASAVFLVIALFFVIFIKQKTAGSRILSETRKQLSEDLNCLKRDDE